MPLRRKLPLLTAALVSLALLVAGVIATTAMHSYLIDQIDTELLRTQNAPPAPPLDATAPTGPPSDLFIQFNNADGSTARQVDNLPTGVSAPALPAMTQAQAQQRADEPFTADGWRVVVTPTITGSVMVAKSLSSVDATVSRLIVLELAVGALVLVAVTLLSTVAVRRSLRPLRQVELTAVGITAGDLSRRIPDPDPRTEVGEVGAALNTMLDELHTSSIQRQAALSAAQDSEARMRQFVADASHELRTPLTSVHGISELYRQGAIPADQIADAFARIEDQSERMAQLVSDLLLLARRDERLPLDRRPVDLLEVCSNAVRTTITQRSVSLEMIPGSRAPIVDGDATGLRQVVDNLMVNAVQHGQGDILVAVGTEGDEAVVRVSDEGPGVPPSDRLRVFDRFYRGADDRSRSTGGSGLGLSIVAAIVAAHGGNVDVQGSVFTVRLPCLPVP